jgi:hypothetical protein
MTTTEPEAPVGGWDWIRFYGTWNGMDVTTKHRTAWNRLFTAPCACGAIVDWDARVRPPEPLCDCEPT